MFRNLVLSRPLAVLDLETTGTDTQEDRIIQICISRICPTGESDQYLSLVNPTIKIPEEATKVHHFRNEDVEHKPTFAALALGIKAFIEGCDLCGYNLKNFDLPLLQAEFRRAHCPLNLQGRRIIDPFEIFRVRESRNLAAALKFYCGREESNLHSAPNDVSATVDVLDAMLLKYPDLPREVAALHELFVPPNAVDPLGKFIRSSDGEIIFNFGKYKGRKLSDIAREKRDYLQWMKDKGGFAEDIKTLVEEELNRTPSLPAIGNPKAFPTFARQSYEPRDH